MVSTLTPEVASIRTSAWKYMIHPGHCPSTIRGPKGEAMCEELFDVVVDPGELHSLAQMRRNVVEELAPRLQAWVDASYGAAKPLSPSEDLIRERRQEAARE